MPRIERDPDVLFVFENISMPNYLRIPYPRWRKLLKMLVKHEGVVLEPYADSLGYRTIGCGHLIRPGEDFPDGVRQPVQKLAGIFSRDAGAHYKLAVDWIGEDGWRDLPEDVKVVLADMAFNLGGKIKRWKNTRRLILNHEWRRLARGLEKTKWYGQVGRRAKHIVSVLDGLSE